MSKQTQEHSRPPMGRGPGHGPGHGPMGMMPGQKAKDFKGTMGKLLTYVRPYWIQMILVMLFAVASTVFAIFSPKILGNATTKIFEGFMAKAAGIPGAGIDFGAVGDILLFLLFLYILSAAFSYIQGFMMAGVTQGMTYRFRKDISEKINRLPLKYFDGTTHGDVLSRITNDVDTVSQSLSQSITQLITSAATLVGVLIMMFSISWLMTLVALLILPVTLLFVTTIVRHSQKFFKQQQQLLGDINGHVEEMYSGHSVMKAFNGEERSISAFRSINEALYGSSWKSQFLSGLMMPVIGFIGNLGYVAVCILGGYLAIRNAIEVGEIQSFIQYVRQFTMPITQTANIANVLQSTAAAAERVFAFLDEQEEVEAPAALPAPRMVKGAVTIDHVRFGYRPEQSILRDFSAQIQPGQKVAIVGPTGAGKTTIVKLLMRFYDVDGGAILVDGTDIRSYRRSDLRNMFGMVLQDTWLFNGTIRENIRYGRLSATDDEVAAAARAAHVDRFVHTLPGGYDMELNEEASNISQGQKQLLTIARAVLADPPILILDEATSSVDTRTEVLIQRAMENLMKGRTSFVIAHRLSTIRDADLILVMRNGDVVEQGTHEVLLAAGGFYASLYNSQFETADEAAS